ncbi:MAG: MmgE/PrpD family protein [Dehalococcoidales bacterium]|nr:MmgE/PrpD family protein [Dehalococcoidales bacterium]
MSTQALARNIVNTRFEDISKETIEATKRSILDTLGVMLPPTTLVSTCEIVYELMAEAGGKTESTLIGFGGKAPCWVAAFVNGSLTHAIDFDDCVGLENPVTHPTGSCFPAALATAERVSHSDGRDLITAVALSNDLNIRMSSTPKGNVLSDYPFFQITTFGVFSATVAAGKLLGLSEDQMINALGLALNRVSGVTKGLFGSDLRAIRDGFSNREGLLCSLLASKGMNSCKDAIEIFFNVYYQDNINLKVLTADLGNHFRGSEVGFKLWPSCHVTHTFIQSVLDAITKYDLKPDNVEDIVIHGNKMAEDLFFPAEIKQKPTTSITAKAAIPFIIGVVLKHRSVEIAHFLPDSLKDPEILAIARKVRFQLDSDLGTFASRVAIKTQDGQIYSAATEILRGNIRNPLSTDELIAKFKDCARYSKKPLSANTLDKLVDSVLNLEKVKDIREITTLLE